MTREEIKEKASLWFLLNPNNSEEEKNCVIEKVMATRATIVSKAALCNIVTYFQKQNAKLKERADDADLNSVLFFNQLCKAKELIKKMLPLMPSGYNDMGNSDLVFEIREEAERFLEEEK